MKQDGKPASSQEIDRSLSTPSEANREKHINYLDDNKKREGSGDSGALKERQKQWSEGIHEGERENNSGDIY